jgi:hypothetical protein
MTTNTKPIDMQQNVRPEPLEENQVQRAVAEEERESLETLEFLQAVDEFKRRTDKAFPTWSEILQILRSLGYHKDYE